MKVELIDSMGDDLSVVNAARVSFDKQSDYDWDADYEWDPPITEKDTKLIKYLSTHNHWSPFAHCSASFRVQAPVFVARQLQKHTVGLAWNEVSRRYVDTDPEFYVPETWRKRAENVKQGSSDTPVENMSMRWGDGTITSESIGAMYYQTYDAALTIYEAMLEAGVCPEQARMVLPQSMMTEWIWTGSLYAFARVCKLRLDSHTQKETQVIAQGISEHMKSLFPVSWEALVES